MCLFIDVGYMFGGMFSSLGIFLARVLVFVVVVVVVVAVPGVNFQTSYQNEVGDAIKTSPLALELLIGF